MVRGRGCGARTGARLERAATGAHGAEAFEQIKRGGGNVLELVGDHIDAFGKAAKRRLVLIPGLDVMIAHMARGAIIGGLEDAGPEP